MSCDNNFRVNSNVTSRILQAGLENKIIKKNFFLNLIEDTYMADLKDDLFEEVYRLKLFCILLSLMRFYLIFDPAILHLLLNYKKKIR